MEMEELKILFRSYGWTVNIHKRRKGTKYVYAARKRQGKVEKVYFAPWSKTEQMTESEVLAWLALISK